MELRHLRYFVAVGEALNFHRASEKLHIAQSPLSQQIRQLEETIGVALFVRSKKRVHLTRAGSLFLEEARAILEKSATAQERARRGARGEEGSLGIGYLTWMANEFLSRIVREFEQTFPNVSLSLNDLIPSVILKGLCDKTLDVGFMCGTFDTEGLSTELVCREHFVVALPGSHELAKSQQIRAQELRYEPFIMVPDSGSMGYNDIIRAICGCAGFHPRVGAEGNQMQSVIWLVHAGLGIALVPASLESLQLENVVYRPLLDSPTIQGMMVWRRENECPVLQQFRHAVLKSVRSNQKL